jgi:hypothetical protein
MKTQALPDICDGLAEAAADLVKGFPALTARAGCQRWTVRGCIRFARAPRSQPGPLPGRRAGAPGGVDVPKTASAVTEHHCAAESVRTGASQAA